MTTTSSAADAATLAGSRLARCGAARRLAWAALFIPCLACAQAHEVEAGPFTLRSNVASSTAIAPSAARRHGIEPAAGRALLDVVVLRDGGTGRRLPVEARVEATASNLAGMQRTIPLRAARSPNGDVSYVGTFDFANREVLDFHITAHPKLRAAPPLRLQYRERMPIR